eukprot:5571688-Amphidinium_carterae.1
MRRLREAEASIPWTSVHKVCAKKGAFVHLCNFMNEDYAHILRMQKERDPKMQAFHSANFYRKHARAMGNHLQQVGLMCFKYLGKMKNERGKYFHNGSPHKPCS